MPKPEEIPAPAVRRLSLYLRQLEGLERQGQRTVSSRELGEPLQIPDAQVRKDLTHLGPLGQPGVGYRVEELVVELRRRLGTDRVWKVLLVGWGNLGRALLAYQAFIKKGFEIVAAFDNDPAIIGRPLPLGPECHVKPMEELAEAIRDHDIRLAVLAVPAPAAQSVADQLIQAGILGILNFAPVALQVPAHIGLANVDLAVHLEQLSFQVVGKAE